MHLLMAKAERICYQTCKLELSPVEKEGKTVNGKVASLNSEHAKFIGTTSTQIDIWTKQDKRCTNVACSLGYGKTREMYCRLNLNWKPKILNLMFPDVYTFYVTQFMKQLRQKKY